MQVGLDAVVQATQVPLVVLHTGVEPVQDVLAQVPALQCRLVVELRHSVVVPVQATHWPETQNGVAAGQAEVPLNAPLAQALRWLVSAHCETVVPQPLPSAAQV